MSLNRIASWSMAVLLGASASLAQAQNDSGDWRQTVFVYGMGAMIEGDSQVGPLQVPVDVSMSDFFDSLDFGAMLAYRLANDEWSFSGDVTYMDLGFRRNTEQGRAGAGLNTEQVTVMATVGRRIRPNLEALLSLAYFDLSADLSVRVLQQTATVSRSVDWVDPLIGLNYDVPLSSRWRFTLRGDIGGFGFGSDLTWHALTKFTYQSSDRFGWYVGYRVIAYDYEEGQGLNYQRYDLRQHGPGLGLSYSF